MAVLLVEEVSVRDRLALLQGVPLFAGLAAGDLLSIALGASVREFSPGEALVRQGDPGDEVLVIVAGRAQVVVSAERDGIETQATLGWLADGETVGELSLLDGQPRSATCLAATPVTCLCINRDEFLAALQGHWELCRQLFAVLAQRVRQADQRVVELSRDPLTGLYCRGALADLYARELARVRLRSRLARGEMRTLAVLFVDVDRFKEINDRYGHATGDEVLRAVAARLSELTRRSDIVARHGGDEFVVLLSDANAGGAAHIAARVRHSLREDPPGPVPFTVSIGVALVDPANPAELDSLLRDADAEMYRDKATRAATG